MTLTGLLQRARVLAELDRYGEADPLLAQVLAQEPDNEEALCLISRATLARKRYPQAVVVLEQLLRAHPYSLRGLLMMAGAQSLLGCPRDGVPFARRAVELYPDNASCLVALAEILPKISSGSAEALSLLENAIDVDPDYLAAYRAAGEIYLDVGRYGDAEHWTLRALEIQADDPWTVLQLGLARAGLGRFEESRDAVLAALRAFAKPNFVNQVIEYVECRGIPDHFAEIYRMALAARGLPDVSYPGAAGDDPKLIAAQGKLLSRMYSAESPPQGRRRAGELAESLLAVDPDNQHARFVRSRTLADAQRYVEALRLAEQLSAEGYPRAHEALIVAQIGLQRHADALATLERVLREKPDSPMYLRTKARCLRNLGRYEEALHVARHAGQLAPSGIDVQLELGLAARSAGDLVLAEQALHTAVEQRPHEREATAYLALLFAKTGRWPQAKTLMATLIPNWPPKRELGGPCLELAGACLNALCDLPGLDDLDPGDPDLELLDEMASLLDLAVDMFAVALAGMHRSDAGELVAKMVGRVAVLRQMAMPENSKFARVVLRFDALVNTWRPE